MRLRLIDSLISGIPSTSCNGPSDGAPDRRIACNGDTWPDASSSCGGGTARVTSSGRLCLGSLRPTAPKSMKESNRSVSFFASPTGGSLPVPARRLGGNPFRRGISPRPKGSPRTSPSDGRGSRSHPVVVVRESGLFSDPPRLATTREPSRFQEKVDWESNTWKGEASQPSKARAGRRPAQGFVCGVDFLDRTVRADFFEGLVREGETGGWSSFRKAGE